MGKAQFFDVRGKCIVFAAAREKPGVAKDGQILCVIDPVQAIGIAHNVKDQALDRYGLSEVMLKAFRVILRPIEEYDTICDLCGENSEDEKEVGATRVLLDTVALATSEKLPAIDADWKDPEKVVMPVDVKAEELPIKRVSVATVAERL